MKIKNAVSDDFTIAELHYLSYIAGLLQQFLILYQTDQPMHPFLLDDLKVLINKYYQSKCTWEIKNSERVTWYKAGWKKTPENKRYPYWLCSYQWNSKAITKLHCDHWTSLLLEFVQEIFVIATLKKINAKCSLFYDVKNCTIFNAEKNQPDKAKYF